MDSPVLANRGSTEWGDAVDSASRPNGQGRWAAGGETVQVNPDRAGRRGVTFGGAPDAERGYERPFLRGARKSRRGLIAAQKSLYVPERPFGGGLESVGNPYRTPTLVGKGAIP